MNSLILASRIPRSKSGLRSGLLSTSLLAIIALSTGCNRETKFAPSAPEQAYKVVSYTIQYSADPNTDAILTLTLEGHAPVTKDISPQSIAALVTMLNGSSVTYKVNANVYVITPKNNLNATAQR